MRAITLIVVCALLSVMVISAVLGRQARLTMKEEKKAKAKSSYTEKYVYIDKEFQNIDIAAAQDMDVELKETDDDRCSVVYFDSDDVKHSVYVHEGTLHINCIDNRTFGSDLGFGDDPYIILYIPESQYGDVSIESESGDISVNARITCNMLEITESKGDVFISGVDGKRADIDVKSGDVTVATMNMEHIEIDGDSGDFSLMNIGAGNIGISSGNGLLEGYDIIASNTVTMTTDRGDIAVEGCEGATMWVKSRKGDVDISLLSDKYILVDSDSGDINVPASSEKAWEKCIVRTYSGNIKLKYVDGSLEN